MTTEDDMIENDIHHQMELEQVVCERNMVQARYANLIRLVSNFVGLLPPPDVATPDGRVFQFNAPDPQDTLRRLRDAVDRMREDLQVSPAPGYNAMELRRGVQDLLATIPAYPRPDMREKLERLLSGTCGKA